MAEVCTATPLVYFRFLFRSALFVFLWKGRKILQLIHSQSLAYEAANIAAHADNVFGRQGWGIAEHSVRQHVLVAVTGW